MNLINTFSFSSSLVYESVKIDYVKKVNPVSSAIKSRPPKLHVTLTTVDRIT